MRGKKAKCDFCGAPFEARRNNAKHCDACRAALKLADRHAQYRMKTGKLAREDYCVAEAGMEIYGQIKHLLRRARKEKKNAIEMSREASEVKTKGKTK